jgi:hypothetical protein
MTKKIYLVREKIILLNRLISLVLVDNKSLLILAITAAVALNYEDPEIIIPNWK